MNTKKLIHLNMSPPVRCYQMYAYPLSVIFTKPDQATPWFLNNFINIKACTHKTKSGYHFIDCRYVAPRYELCEWFIRYTISQSIIRDEGLFDLHSMIQKAIERDLVVSMVVDEFYIKNRKRYQKEHKRHQLLINGYDNLVGQYDIIGYDINGHYCSSRIAQNDLENAFINYSVIDNYQDQFVLMGIKNNCKSQVIDLYQIAKELSEYIHSENTYCPEAALYHYKKDFVYGLMVYEKIKEYFYIPDYRFVNYPLFYMIYEHKRNNVFRAQYIQQFYNCDLCNELNVLQHICELTQNMYLLFMKYMITTSTKMKYVNRIEKYLDQIMTLEREVLSSFLEKITRLCHRRV